MSMAMLFSFFLQHRVLRTDTPPGERMEKGERDLAYFYNSEMEEGDRDSFRDFLYELGFKIKVCEGGVIRGLPTGAVYFVLTRRSEGSAPSWIDLGSLYAQTSFRTAESRRITTVWNFVIWMQMLSSLYTANKRSPLSVSEYNDPNISLTNKLVSIGVQSFLDETLQKSPDTDTEFIKILRKHTKTEVKRRVNNFLNFLCDIGHLKKIEKNNADKDILVYQQTLLGAIEIAEHHRQGLNHLIPPSDLPLNETILENIEQINPENDLIDTGDE